MTVKPVERCWRDVLARRNPLWYGRPYTILGDNTPPWRQLRHGDNPLPKLTPPRLKVLTLTDPQRGVLTLTLTLTDPRGGELSKTGTNPHS